MTTPGGKATASRLRARGASASGGSYSEAVERLLWLGHEGRSLKWDLENIRRVLERLGHPERRFPAVHIAGTNGKGSVAAMVESILRQAGYRTGLYTSPHLVCINERIAVEGTSIGDQDFATAFGTVSEAIEGLMAHGSLPGHPSYFETLTAMAFWRFAQAGIEVGILEVGLGGRLDATNVMAPAVCAITAVDFDHERYLGRAIEQIAAEKAGIIKPGVPVVNAAQQPVARAVVATRAAQVGAPLLDVADIRVSEIASTDWGRYEFTVQLPDAAPLRLRLSLRGRFQIQNALTALAIVGELQREGWRIPPDAIETGLTHTHWPGRLQLVHPPEASGEAQPAPLLFLDGAHNPAGARRLAEFWNEHLRGQRIHLVYGTVRDKAVEEIAELLFPPAASVTLTRPQTSRAASVESLASLARSFHDRIAVEPDSAAALDRAWTGARPGDVVFVAGSLFLVGDCLRTLEARASLPMAEPAATHPAATRALN